MNSCRGKCFTLIEMLMVISILGIMSGLLFPSLSRAKQKAKHVRWVSFNASLNADPNTVINYNFENPDFKTSYQGKYFPALYSSATGCEASGFVPDDYHGILMNNPEWKRAGRWKSKTCIQFDGRSSYVLVPGKQSLDFNPSKDDFTISAWVNLDNLNGAAQTLFSKSEWTSAYQYDAYFSPTSYFTDVGTSNANWSPPAPKTGEWINVALVSEAGNYKFYVNGKAMTSSSTQTSAGTTTTATTGGNQGVGQGKGEGQDHGKGQGLDKGGTTTTTTTIPAIQKTSNNFIIGAAGLSSNGAGFYFQGRMDEFLLFKRTLSASEIKNIYEMGSP